MIIELNRSEFKKHTDDDETYFDDILYRLGVVKQRRCEINSVEIDADFFNCFDDVLNTVR